MRNVRKIGCNPYFQYDTKTYWKIEKICVINKLTVNSKCWVLAGSRFGIDDSIQPDEYFKNISISNFVP